MTKTVDVDEVRFYRLVKIKSVSKCKSGKFLPPLAMFWALEKAGLECREVKLIRRNLFSDHFLSILLLECARLFGD